MAKNQSRVAQEAREAGQRAAQLQRQIKKLSSQINNPEKHFVPKSDEGARSAVEKFWRYFTANRGAVVGRRKATRGEMRAQRNRAIFWAVVAFIATVVVCARVLRMIF